MKTGFNHEGHEGHEAGEVLTPRRQDAKRGRNLDFESPICFGFRTSDFGFLFFVLFVSFVVNLRSADYTVFLGWNPSTNASVDRYRAWVSTLDRTNVYPVPACACTSNWCTRAVPAITDTATNWFWITALSVDGEESPPSNKVPWTPPQLFIRLCLERADAVTGPWNIVTNFALPPMPGDAGSQFFRTRMEVQR